MIRLETTARHLAEKLKCADTASLRKVAYAACEYAIASLSIEDAQILNVLTELQSQQKLTAQTINGVKALAEKFDNEYLALQDRDHIEPDERIRCLALFGKARVAQALAFAGGSDALSSAMEAIYEATMAIGDGNRLYDRLMTLQIDG